MWCDMRSGGLTFNEEGLTNDETDEKFTKEIEKNMTSQMQWFRTIGAVRCMLKMRLSWTDDMTDYLDGEIRFQAWAPETSTETRLIAVKGCGMRKYDNRGTRSNSTDSSAALVSSGMTTW